MKGLGADVTERIFPGMGHTIVEEEMRHIREVVDGLVGEASG
jgi:predicted esterase